MQVLLAHLDWALKSILECPKQISSGYCSLIMKQMMVHDNECSFIRLIALTHLLHTPTHFFKQAWQTINACSSYPEGGGVQPGAMC